MTKEEIKQEFKLKFYNGSFIEIHSGDLEDIIDLVYNIINKPSETTNEEPILLCPECRKYIECPNCGISEPNNKRFVV